MCLRYSFSVVAPIHCNSPRASAGLRMLAASTELPAAPAPTSMCNSSMNRIVSVVVISSMTRFRRSSNWPRYMVPATSEPTSRRTSRLSIRSSGTCRATMRCASPSTIAVLPTPGSPMRAGLFLVRRARICTTRSISFCRPITGSSSPRRAASVRSVPSCSSNDLSLDDARAD